MTVRKYFYVMPWWLSNKRADIPFLVRSQAVKVKLISGRIPNWCEASTKVKSGGRA